MSPFIRNIAKSPEKVILALETLAVLKKHEITLPSAELQQLCECLLVTKDELETIKKKFKTL